MDENEKLANETGIYPAFLGRSKEQILQSVPDDFIIAQVAKRIRNGEDPAEAAKAVLDGLQQLVDDGTEEVLDEGEVSVSFAEKDEAASKPPAKRKKKK
jgi:hypothetical protein